jgi:glycosyltransferase involved in cell wall biosynthesis
MPILLTICIPTYNRAMLLAKALDSVLPQVCDNSQVEVLISDNASTDTTWTVVRDYQVYYPQIRYHRNTQNEGFDGNIAACIEQAQGEHISFFSDDDLAPPGVFAAILNALVQHKPAVLYINHYPFYGGDYRLRTGIKHPEYDRAFADGKSFLLFAGLGFISALTVKREYAREFLPYIKRGLGQAHLDIAARIALLKPGPFVFLGTQAVAARVPPQPAYDSVTGAALNEALFYHGLKADRLLDSASVQRRVGGSIRHNLFRAVLAKKCSADHAQLAEQKAILIETYKHYPQFYLWVYPILLLPRHLLIGPYRLSRALVRRRYAWRQPPGIE